MLCSEFSIYLHIRISEYENFHSFLTYLELLDTFYYFILKY